MALWLAKPTDRPKGRKWGGREGLDDASVASDTTMSVAVASHLGDLNTLGV